MRNSFSPGESHHERSTMASSTNQQYPDQGGRAPGRRWRRRKKRTRMVDKEVQTCPEIAPNFYNMLQENGPSECEGVVETQFHPNGHPDDEDWEDNRENDGEQEWWNEEEDWWSDERDRWHQNEPDASMELEMGDQTQNENSSRGPFAWLSNAWGSRVWGRPTQRANVVGGTEIRGKGGSIASGHSDPQDGHHVGGMGCAEQGKGKWQAKGSKGPQ